MYMSFLPPRLSHLLMDPTLCEFGFPPLQVELNETGRLGTYYGFIYGGDQSTGPMIKWMLNRGDGENSIIASGTQYDTGYYKAYTLTGITGPLEGGRVPVDLKIDYAAVWMGITLTGHFDLEENSLRGAVRWENGSLGDFVFKRNPDFVRLYPAPSTIDARARWNFATAVIGDRVQRQLRWPSYILKRIKDGKRYMELALRDDYYGKRLDDEERGQYNKLLSSLYETDARFYASRINVKLSEATIQYVSDRLWGF